MFDTFKEVVAQINQHLTSLNDEPAEKARSDKRMSCSTNSSNPSVNTPTFSVNSNIIMITPAKSDNNDKKNNSNGCGSTPSSFTNSGNITCVNSSNKSNGNNSSSGNVESVISHLAASINSGSQVQYCGPYKLEKTLGKGQTGLVKTGIHCITGRKVAVKIVNKERLSESVLQKVEREIAIMKLIEHPHVLHLYDVYENKKYLYLLLEHVSGGELFDYLVKKGRLMAKEARKFFRQIISALDFCHAYNICHRDLKPENLLLDERNNIKVADFGMASLQVEGSMLETSCGSPHYACPEVIRGEKYDGRRADVWSCGVILYALLVGALPFDDDNLRNLLEKVKKGVFHIPHFVPSDCQNLLRSMIEVDPSKRITLANVFRHPWVAGTTKSEPELELPMSQVVQTHIIPSEENIDPDVFRHMNSLGCFKNKENLINSLLSSKHNTEKMVYFLLLDRKRRRPAQEDDTEIIIRGNTSSHDPPRKRTDTSRPTRYPYGSISEGSPINPRKTFGRYTRQRHSSLGGSPTNSPNAIIRDIFSTTNHNTGSNIVKQDSTGNRHIQTYTTADVKSRNGNRASPVYHYHTQPIDPIAVATASRQTRSSGGSNASITSTCSTKVTTTSPHNPSHSSSSTSTNSSNMITSMINVPQGSGTTSVNSSTTSLSTVTSNVSNTSSSSGPWRSKLNNIKNSFLGTPRFHRRKMSSGSSVCESDSEDTQILDTADLVKKSWFGSLTSNMSQDRDDVQCVPVDGRSLNGIKAELIRTFLTIHELSHSVIGQNSFKVEYKRGPTVGGGVFSRGIKMQVDILLSPHVNNPSTPIYVVQFTLLAGPLRRFKRLVDHLSVVLQSNPQQRGEMSQQASIMVKPRRLSDSSVGSNCSETMDPNLIGMIVPNRSSQMNERADKESQQEMEKKKLKSNTQVGSFRLTYSSSKK
uniref:non-specific serine/threonine protein kinase n=1 Tax=Strongyloides papillosus TaxID=174720 RepID=A0A0N5B5E4_STREA